MDTKKELFQSKIFVKYTFNEKLNLQSTKFSIIGSVLILLAITLYLVNSLFLENEILFKTIILIGIFGFVLLLIGQLLFSFIEEFGSGKLKDDFVITKNSVSIGDEVFYFNNLTDFKYIVTDFKGKEPHFLRYDLENNILSRRYGKGVLNWISFTQNGVFYKKRFYLESEKHLQSFNQVMNLLISEGVSIKKALEF